MADAAWTSAPTRRLFTIGAGRGASMWSIAVSRHRYPGASGAVAGSNARTDPDHQGHTTVLRTYPILHNPSHVKALFYDRGCGGQAQPSPESW
jgi:hypothetical protein